MIYRAIALALAASAVTVGAHAQAITFESDEEILIIRGVDLFGSAMFELVGPRDGNIRCLALNAEGQPIASTVGFAETGQVTFMELDVADVDRVACRYI